MARRPEGWRASSSQEGFVGLATYRWRAVTMTSVMVRPSSFAFSVAASQSGSGTRMLCLGVSPVFGLATAATSSNL